MRVRPAPLARPQLSIWYLSIWGPLLLVLGVGSLIVNPDFGVGDDVTEKHLFGLFETNGWHGLAGASAGVAAVVSAWSRRWIREVALGVALISGMVPAVIFLVSGDGSAALGIIPVDVTDAVTLHLVPGLIGLACVAGDAVRTSAGAADGTSGVSVR